MSVKIVYEDIAAGAAEDAEITTADAADFSTLDNLPFGGSDAPIASLEPYSWVLDGSREILYEQPVAFWSREMSDVAGYFEAPPEITITFNKRYTSPGLFLTFDTATGDYCTRMTVEWYRGKNVIKKMDYTPSNTEYFCQQTVEAWDKIVLRFRSTSQPFRYAKLQKIVFGVDRTFLRPELRNVKITQEVSVVSAQIAVNTLDFTLDSRADVDYMFQMKQPITAYDGDHMIGVFFIDDSKKRAKGLYDVSCKDAIGVLDDDPFPAGIYQDYQARQLLLDILGGHFELDIDAVLADVPITGYIPDGSRREALQQVAFALCAMVDTSGTDKIRVYRDREDMPKKISDHRVYTGGTVDTAAIVTAVQVTAHNYSTVGEGNETVEVGGVTYYHTSEITTINNPNVTASDKANVIEAKEATLVNPGNVASVAQHLYSYYNKRQKQRARIVMSGERPGDHVAVPTLWNSVVDGFISSMHIVLSGIAAAECEVIGVDVEAVGGTEAIMSGEFMSGEV